MQYFVQHDNYMAGMQRLLGHSDTFVNPNFGSAYIFELRMSKLFYQDYFVRILLKNTVFPGLVKINEIKMRGKYYDSDLSLGEIK